MAFSSSGAVVVKATVYGSDGSCVRVVKTHADITPMTTCEDLLEIANSHAEEAAPDATRSSFSLCKSGPRGEHYTTLGLDEEDFVTETVLMCESGSPLAFSDTSGVTFSAKYTCSATNGTNQVHHHVHPSEEHLLDISLMENVTPEDVAHCHSWGIFNAKQLCNAPKAVLPKRLQNGISRVVAVMSKPDETPEALFDVSFGSHGFMHTEAPLKSLPGGRIGLSFHLDAETVHVRSHHADAIGHHLFNDERVSGSIGTAVKIQQSGDIAVTLRHSDTSTLALLDDGVCPTRLEQHQCSHHIAHLDTKSLQSSIKVRDAHGHVYAHNVTKFDDEWRLNEVTVHPYDSPASLIRMALLQNEDHAIVLSCGFEFADAKRETFINDVVAPFGANIQGGSDRTDGFDSRFDSVSLSVVWNDETYTHDAEHEWFIEPNTFPLDRTRFGDLYIQILNIVRGRRGVALDIPRVAGNDYPRFVDLQVSWTNDRGAQVTYNEPNLRYEKLWYEEQGDESGWSPFVVGTLGLVGSFERQNFDPRSGDRDLTVVFDIGGPVDTSTQLKQSRAQEAGTYTLLPGGRMPHTHTVVLGDDLNGLSSLDNGHTHAVIGGIVQSAFGHTHELELQTVID